MADEPADAEAQEGQRHSQINDHLNVVIDRAKDRPIHQGLYARSRDFGMLCNWEQSVGDAERTLGDMKSSLAPRTPQSDDVPAEYRSLHKYLDGRYADTVVLRFAEIEDLLG